MTDNSLQESIETYLNDARRGHASIQGLIEGLIEVELYIKTLQDDRDRLEKMVASLEMANAKLERDKRMLETLIERSEERLASLWLEVIDKARVPSGGIGKVSLSRFPLLAVIRLLLAAAAVAAGVGAVLAISTSVMLLHWTTLIWILVASTALFVETLIEPSVPGSGPH